MNSFISLILPAFNEKDNILPLIDEIHHELRSFRYEIIVIDDKSEDETAAALKIRNDPKVRLITNETRVGLGRSIQQGMDAANGDFLIVMDSDFNHQPRYLRFMVNAMEVYDCAFASRFYAGGGMDNMWRQGCSRSFNWLIQLLTNSRIKDNLYGFFIVKREVLDRCPFQDIFWGYGDYCMRLIYYLQRNTERILQFPAVNGVRRYGRGNPHLMKTFIQYSKALIRFSYKIRTQYD